MDLDRIDPQVIIILVIMVVGGIRWVLEQIKGAQGGVDADQRADDDLEDLYEEARREIFERQTTVQPPPVQPPPFEARPEVYVPPTIDSPPEPPAPPPLPDWNRKVTKPRLSAAEQEALARAQSRLTGRRHRRRERPGQTGSRIRKLLSSPTSARDAIVLSEILGPPKGAQR